MTCSKCGGNYIKPKDTDGDIICHHCGRILETTEIPVMPIPVRQQQCKKTTGGYLDVQCIDCSTIFRAQRRNGKTRERCKSCYDRRYAQTQREDREREKGVI